MASPNITVQVKGGTTKVQAATTGSATRLVELSDVQSTPVHDQEVLTYVAANARFEFQVQASETANDNYARARANGAFDEANAAFLLANTANLATLHDVDVSGIPSLDPALSSNGAVIFYDVINTKYSFTQILNGGLF